MTAGGMDPPEARREPAPAGAWRGLYGLVALGLGLRLAVAFASESVHHPDEVFQYSEQAHRLVFHYGVIPWEYRFGARSWLLPLFISGPLEASRLLRLDDPAYYIPLVKIVFCLLSVSLIVSVYRIGRNLVSEAVGRLAAVFACFWYELLYFAPRSLADVVATYFLVFALACATERAGRPRTILFGLSLAAAAALRMHYLPVVAFLLLLAASNWRWPALGRSIAVLLGAVLLVGFLDDVTWGRWFASYYNYYFYNVLHGFATTFGTMRHDWYLRKLTLASAGLFPLVILLSLCFLRRLWIPLVWLLLVVGAHTLVPLKDYRFIFPAVPILLVMTAAVTLLLAARAMPARTTQAAWAATGLVVLIALAGIFGRLPREHDIYPIRPLYAQDELRAFVFLHREADLAGLLLEGVHWSQTGGYYYLHRNVPLYLATETEAMRRENGAGPRAYVSHIVCPASMHEINGYTPVARFGAVEVRKQLAHEAPYSVLASHTHDVPQPGIDGVYVPSVRVPFRLGRRQ